ncbi:MAG: ATP-dependent DNA helicase RecG [bacterium]|nr:ATP-dependent DNA helicase RecG [bacterium]
MPDLKLDSPLQFVKGVGPKRGEALAHHGLSTVRDLLAYLPRHYLDRTNVVPINRLRIGENATIIGEVKAHGVLRGKKPRYEVMLQDDTGAISLLWFAAIRYWERYFKKGMVFAATGTITDFMGLQMVHPDLERLEENTDRMIHAGRIIPVYPQTAAMTKLGLSSKGIRQLTTYIFEHLREKMPDQLPPEEQSKIGLPNLHDAIRGIHYPENRDEIETSRRRLAFDELLGLQFVVFQNLGKKKSAQKGQSYAEPSAKLTQFKESLPYELTDGQKKVTREIFVDLAKRTPMSRLLQGDVGCGKTVVAVLAALYAAENRLQVAFMAPTEILAEQHFRNWAGPLAQVGVEAGILTSTLSAPQRKAVARKCAEGQIDVLFGTHALIYDYVSFERLGLVIIDEQHRFGVEQRGKLFAKGDSPDLLVMTATPIPRTLALTLYGDLDISTIEDLPPGRKPIRTVWRLDEARPKIFEYVHEQVKAHGQGYVIYPLIEKSEQSDLENVEDAYAELALTFFRDLKLGMVHGRIKPKERDDVLLRFRKGEIDLLMATTVIEVGLDNPNATLMVIEHAERFGLAQLHQLRGRVGRGEKQSTVIAIAHGPLSDIAQQRLEYFAANTNGFQIAEADLQLRGPGELFGVRQSGAPELRAANLTKDRDLLEASRTLLEQLFHDPAKLDRPYKGLYQFLKTSAEQRQIQLGGG